MNCGSEMPVHQKSVDTVALKCRDNPQITQIAQIIYLAGQGAGRGLDGDDFTTRHEDTKSLEGRYAGPVPMDDTNAAKRNVALTKVQRFRKV